MPVYFSHNGNPEVWEKKPDGYYTPKEWETIHSAKSEPNLDDLLIAYVAAIQTRLDEFARTRGYDGILNAATYANSTIPKYQVEGEYAMVARDATWLKANEIMNGMVSDSQSIPTIDEVMAELPILAWPE